MSEKSQTVTCYCDYCKKQIPHEVVSAATNKEGTGGKRVCRVCGSARLGTIQGYDAALM